MDDDNWPPPPIWWDDLPKVVELLGLREANRRFAGWVLVPAGWCLSKTAGPSGHRSGGGSGWATGEPG